MAFDDLARHMASRDKRVLSKAASADEMVAEAAQRHRSQARQRDLILGPALLVGGLVGLVLALLTLADALDPKPNPMRPPEDGTIHFPTFLITASAGATITGLKWTLRGLRGRST